MSRKCSDGKDSVKLVKDITEFRKFVSKNLRRFDSGSLRTATRLVAYIHADLAMQLDVRNSQGRSGVNTAHRKRVKRQVKIPAQLRLLGT